MTKDFEKKAKNFNELKNKYETALGNVQNKYQEQNKEFAEISDRCNIL